MFTLTTFRHPEHACGKSNTPRLALVPPILTSWLTPQEHAAKSRVPISPTYPQLHLLTTVLDFLNFVALSNQIIFEKDGGYTAVL